MKTWAMRAVSAMLFAAMLLSASVAMADGRLTESFNADWTFFYAGEAAMEEAAAVEFDDAAWEAVNLPHTWNGLDAQDGGNNYARGYGWYRKDLEWKPEYEGQRLFLRFLGASMISEVYVNGQHVNSHAAAYTALSCEITDYVKPGETNVIAVRCDNRKTADVAPQGGDFSVQGGLYRNAYLIATNDVHVDALNMGSTGLFLTTTDVSEEAATLTVKAGIVNDGAEAKTVTVKAVLSNPDTFEAIATVENPIFDVTTMAPGGQVGEASAELTIAAGETVTFEEVINVASPRLWNGLEDPYRYVVELTVEENGVIVDQLSDYVGFRYFEMTADKGLFLNGERYQLHGVSRHQDTYNKGYALEAIDHETDLGLIYEIGANAVRLAHYPQDPYFYELCDRYGIVVWAEIPHVGGTLTTAEFAANLEMQTKEMIRQHYNHPSILFWGLQNEIKDAKVVDMMANLNQIAKAEDPTRFTTQAIERQNPPIYDTDVIAYNIYPNWYYEGTVADMMDVAYALEDNRALGISEYGAGASLYQHEENAQLSIGQSRGQWHPEEFQANWHETAIRDIAEREFIWCNFVWNMFDFASDGKAEGGQLGINDKGLVSHNRQTRKDAFYLYKANWNDREDFVHITSKRYDVRDYETIEVKVYSNCETVTLTVNGAEIGTATNNGFGVFVFEGIKLNVGENTLSVVTDCGETDSCVLTRVLSSTPTLDSADEALFVVDNQNAEITLNTAMTVAQFKAALVAVNGTTWALEGAEADEADLSVAMTVKAVSQDETATAVYTLVEPNLASAAALTAGTTLKAYPLTHINDQDGETYWSADRGGKGWIVMDLGAEYSLTDLTVDWLNLGMKTRTYKYTIDVSLDGETFTTVVDKSEGGASVPSTESLRVTDDLADVRARYVKLNVTGGPSWSECVEINEIKLNGYNIASETYTVDHEAKTISFAKPADTLAWEAFEAQLTISGTNKGVTNETGAYYVSSGDLYIIIDAQGEEIPYTVLFLE